MTKSKFSAPNDRLVKIVSNAAIIISLLLLFNIVHNGLNTDTVAIGLLIPIVLVAWIFHPSGYVLDDGKLQIKRPLGNKDNLVIISENDEKLTIISPADNDSFIAGLTEKLNLGEKTGG